MIKLLFPMLLYFALGIACSVLFRLPMMSAAVSTFLLCLTWLFWSKAYPTTKHALLVLLCFSFGVFYAGYRIQQVFAHECTPLQSPYNGVILSYPELSARGMTFSFLGEDQCAYIVVLANPTPVSIGDRVSLLGVKHQPPHTQHLRMIQYIHVSSGALYVRSVESLVQAARVFSVLDSIRMYISKSVEGLSSRARGLFLGMMLGEKQALSYDIQQTFVLSGLIHIVVLSGQNLSFMGILFWKGARRFGFVFGLSVGIIATLLYVCIGGAEPPSLRAGLMAVLLFVAYGCTKYPHGPRLLWMSVAFMLILSPLLLTNMSFLLSCLAMVAIFYAVPIVEHWMLRKKWPVALIPYLAPIVAVQVFLLPLLVLLGGAVTPYAFLANILVLCLTPVVALVSLFHILVFTLHPLLAEWSTNILLESLLGYILSIARAVSVFPYVSISVSIPAAVVWVWYGICAIYFYRIWKTKTITPLSIFTLREDRVCEERGVVPWFHDSTETFPPIAICPGQCVRVSSVSDRQNQERAPIIWT